jgi:hypothetical protein
MRRLSFLLAMPLLAAVDGTVVNQTSGKPQAGATVTLYKLGQDGMESLVSVKSADGGKFVIDRVVSGPHLIQTAFDGVTYNHMLPPGRPTTGLSLTVYNADSKPGDSRATTHMILLEPDGQRLNVSESIIYKNEGNTTYNDPTHGTLRVFLPEAAGGKVRVMCTAPQGMPIERAAEKTTAGTYKIDFPIKPGETRFDVTYAIPMAGDGSFSSKVLHTGGPVRVVAPQGVTLESEALALLGQEPNSQASVFELKNKTFTIAVRGTGALQGASQEAGEEEGQGIQKVKPFLYDRFYPVLGISFFVLALGFALLYRKRVAEVEEAQPEPPRKDKKEKRR